MNPTSTNRMPVAERVQRASFWVSIVIPVAAFALFLYAESAYATIEDLLSRPSIQRSYEDEQRLIAQSQSLLLLQLRTAVLASLVTMLFLFVSLLSGLIAGAWARRKTYLVISACELAATFYVFDMIMRKALHGPW